MPYTSTKRYQGSSQGTLEKEEGALSCKRNQANESEKEGKHTCKPLLFMRRQMTTRTVLTLNLKSCLQTTTIHHQVRLLSLLSNLTMWHPCFQVILINFKRMFHSFLWHFHFLTWRLIQQTHSIPSPLVLVATPVIFSR